MKRLALLLSGCLLLPACRRPAAVAEVGDARITQEDFAFFASTQSSRTPPTDKLEALVRRELLAEEARRDGLQKTPAMRARLAAAEREVLAQALLEQRLSKGSESSSLRQRYEKEKESLGKREIHVRDIVVRFSSNKPGGGKEAARTRANALYARISGGVPFEAVAKSESEDRVTGMRGGELPPIREGQVDPAFFQAAVQLKPNEISKPVETSVGMVLIQAIDTPRTWVPSFEEARGVLAARVRQESEAELFDSLRKQIRVKTYPERLP